MINSPALMESQVQTAAVTQQLQDISQIVDREGGTLARLWQNINGQDRVDLSVGEGDSSPFIDPLEKGSGIMQSFLQVEDDLFGVSGSAAQGGGLSIPGQHVNFLA